jgi:DNA repair exonuclease SbcCD ATPase subunit
MSSPIVFKELQIRNFLSFGNNTTTIDLRDIGSTLIIGENVDANSNNGAGKTTIINALCYALYNKPFDNISLQRLINGTNNLKSTLMETRLFFEKGNDQYEIYRCRGESFNIQIMMNDEDITLDSVSENDKFIQDLIGMSYELFTKIIIFSGNSVPFLQMPVAQQRQQIEELFNITLLTEKAIRLKEIIKTTEGSVSVQEAIIREQEAQLALYDRQLIAAENRVNKWEDDRIAQVESLTQNLELLSKVDMVAEKELHSMVAEVEKLLSPLNNKFTLAKRDRSTLVTDIKKLSSELSHLLDEKCPYCMQQYGGAGDKLAEKQTLLDKKQTTLDSIEGTLTEVESEIVQMQMAVNEAKASMKFSSLEAAIRAEQTAATAQQKIDDLIEAENPHTEALEQLKTSGVKVASYEELDNLKKDLEHQYFLLKLLTDKNSFIRRKIINRTIPFLNNRLGVYTKDLGLPHVVKFDDDMSCTVSEYGRELDFGNLSSGEKKRVNLSLSLAFRDVLHHLHSRVNCLFIDEIDASLDGSGVENVFRMLKQKSRDDGLALWIISHRPEAVGRFDRTVTVRKENGFSRIIEQEEDLEAA